MDSNALRAKIHAAIEKAGQVSGIDTFRRIMDARQQKKTLAEQEAEFQKWLGTRPGRRYLAARDKRAAAKNRRAQIAKVQQTTRDAVTKANQARAAAGEFDHLSPHVGRNVRTALANAEKAAQR